MLNDDRKLKARQVREAHLQQRAQRRAGRAELAPPVIVDAIAGDQDGLLPVDKLTAPIAIRVPDWRTGTPPPGFRDQLVLEWKMTTDNDYVRLLSEDLVHPITEAFPLERAIPLNALTGREGQFDFRYGVKAFNDSQMVFPLPVPVTLDRTPPYGVGTPPAVEDIGRVTETELAAGIKVTIPDFQEDKKEFVTILLVWTIKPPPANTPLVPDITDLLPANREISVPRTVIDKFPSGDHYIAYELVDKAGNRSRTSSIRTVPVVLGELPDLLKPPVVPLATPTDGNLIDLEDAHVGVTVEIPLYDHHHFADQVVVTWGNSELPGVPVGETPPDPVSVPVTWAHLDDEYTSDPDDQVTPVSYVIRRGTTDFEEGTGGIEVNVNFAYTGPENPDEPDPVNPNLALVLVKGASGIDNHLVAGDANQDAAATFALYDPPTAGDVITLFWKGVAVADTYTLDGTETVGDDISLTLLWSEILAGGAGTVPAYYSLSHPDFVNEQRSRITPVTVDAIPIDLPKATFTDLANPGGGNMLNCESLRKRTSDGAIGYRVHVPASSYLVPGEDIEFNWTLLDASDVPVPDSELSASVTIPDAAATNGVDWFIQPYDVHILPSYTETTEKWAFGEVVYTLTINGNPVSAPAERQLVALQDLDEPSGSCDITSLPEFP